MRCLKFFFICLGIAFRLPAQELFFSQPPNFQNLPSFETYDIFQDSKGFIWISSDAGICRYDGKKLTVFTTKDGISENVVFKIYEDNKGRIWFTTLSGYFFYYYKNRFHSIDANGIFNEKLVATINSFFIGENDTLYCPTKIIGSYGIMKIPPQNNYRDIIVDTSLFLNCNRYIFSNKLHPDECIMGYGNTPESTSYWLRYNKASLEIFLGDQGHDEGNKWNGKTDIHGNAYVYNGKLLNIISKEGKIKGYYFMPNRIVSSYLDKDNDLWVCTQRGGYMYKNADLTKPAIRFLTGLSISNIFVDREETIWVTTLQKGVFFSKSKNVLFFNENNDKATYLQKCPDQLNITFDSQKIIMLKNDTLEENEELKNMTNFTDRLISCYLDEKQSYLGFENTLMVWDRLHKNTMKIPNIHSHYKQILKVGADSILFISSRILTLAYKNQFKKIYTNFSNQYVLQLKNKKILVSSRYNKGIYELKRDTITNYFPTLPELKVRINCMLEDVYGNLWLATNEHGLYCYDYKKKLHHFTTYNNLVSDKINTLASDSKNNLWLGSYNGLTKLSYSRNVDNVKILNFNTEHGLPDNQIDQIASFKQKIICISKTTCFFFEEDKLTKNTVAPYSYIESVFINDSAYPVNVKTILNYNQNNIRVQASSITYKNTQERKFLYKLIGYDDNWHSSSSGEIQYTNLPHGRYVLTMYALNNDNLKSNRPTTFRFIIKRPFWLTWWFIFLEIILFVVLFYFAFKFWKSRIQKREHHKAMINQKIAEFKMTALRSQMNPHFVFNAISSIQHYILKQDTFKSYNYLAKFSLLIRTILDNSKEEYIALSQEINTLKLYIELEQIRFKSSFKFILNIDKNLEMDTHIPTMLIQPYVENSIWHGLMPKQTNCILEIALEKRNTYILITIRDNGVGRNYVGKKDKPHESKGMSITEQRIKELQTTNEKKFDVTILDLTDEKGNPTGTEVRIIIPFDL